MKQKDQNKIKVTEKMRVEKYIKRIDKESDGLDYYGPKNKTKAQEIIEKLIG